MCSSLQLYLPFLHVFGIDKQFLMILCQGLIFSWLYYKTDHLNYSIVAHILTNVIVTILHYM
ncbi:CPBP family glutamic-type intramembrane protease [Streptococcus fryi]